MGALSFHARNAVGGHACEVSRCRLLRAGAGGRHGGDGCRGGCCGRRCRGVIRTWAAELVDKGIRVNTVVPGPVETPGLKGLAPSGQEQALLDAQASHVPMGRVGRPEEVAAAVLFLASDESSFMTGTELFVDGGERQL